MGKVFSSCCKCVKKTEKEDSEETSFYKENVREGHRFHSGNNISKYQEPRIKNIFQSCVLRRSIHLYVTDPTKCPTPRTMFLKRYYIAKLNEAKGFVIRNFVTPSGRLEKSSSCSTIYTHGMTISHPNFYSTMFFTAYCIYLLIKHRDSSHECSTFSELAYPFSSKEMQEEYRSHDPSSWEVYTFILHLIEGLKLGKEVSISSLIYLERILTTLEIEMTPETWRRMTVGAILLAAKVKNNRPIMNIYFSTILGIADEYMFELERAILQIFEYNVNISQSVYAMYYFDLLYIIQHEKVYLPRTLLTRDVAVKMEAMDCNWLDHPKCKIRKFHSSEDMLSSMEYLDKMATIDSC